FKTPWEFYAEGRSYDVVLSTQNAAPDVNARIMVVYGSEEKQLDFVGRITIGQRYSNISLDYDGIELPIYGEVLSFEGVGQPLAWIKCNSKIVGLTIDRAQGKLSRVDSDLFQELAI